MPQVRIIDGSGTGLVIPIAGGRVAIGREEGNQLKIEDPKSSRYHAEIVFERGHWCLNDLNSSNGTWTDLGRVDSLVLRDGMTFRIGRTQIAFEMVSSGIGTVVEKRTAIDRASLKGLVKGPVDKVLFSKGGTEPLSGGDLIRQNAYLILLHQMIERTRECQGRDQLFDLVDDAAAEVLEGDRCAVLLPVDGGELGGWALWPAHERRLRARYGSVPFARALLAAVRSGREPLLCSITVGDLDPTASMIQSGVHSAMAAPLRTGATVHGLLYVDRMREGAPFSRTDLEFLAAVANQLAVALANQEKFTDLTAEVERLQTRPVDRHLELVGSSLLPTLALIERIAPTRVHVLILGESGTGKDHVARLLHQRSPRAEKPFQSLSCSGADPERLEVTLFGQNGPGLIELADQGTLVLQDIAELPLAVQVRLVRMLDQGEVQRIGEATTRRADVRIVATAARELAGEVINGRMRSDLCERLSAFSIQLPPLREREGDLDQLIDHLLKEIAARLDQPLRHLLPEARIALLRHPWPGNIRQLKQVLERACIAADEAIGPGDLPEFIRPHSKGEPAVGSVLSLAEVERTHILKVLDQVGGNKKAAAELLDIDRSTLYAKLRQYGRG